MANKDMHRFMQMAIDLSEKAVDCKNSGPFGDVIVRENMFIWEIGKSGF